MINSLVLYLFSEPMLRIVRGLALSPEPLHLREISTRYELSPAGVTDILKRLNALGVLKEQRISNRRYISLNLSVNDEKCIKEILRSYEENLIRERTQRFSKRAADKLKWMDQAFILFNKKLKLRDTTKTS